jgi:hypothetical protein
MSQTILQLKLTLVDIKPPIWRRLLVPSQITLRRLHEIIQALTGWSDVHQHEFVIAERRYGEPAPCEVIPVHNEMLARLHALPLTVGTFFGYVYDFGDHWEIELKVERITPPDPNGTYPLVLDGARAFPLEDSGGVSGYKDLLAALVDPGHPEHEESRSWAGGNFDSEPFDLLGANRRLGSLRDQA